MSILMYHWIAFSLEASEATNWQANANDIIRQAYQYIHSDKHFSDAAFDALNRIAKKFHQLGVPGWKSQQSNHALTSSSEIVVGTKNYTCILPHIASASNMPETGSEWEIYWVEAGENGIVWVSETQYTSASVIAAASDVLDVEQVSVIDAKSKFPVIKTNRFFFESLDKSAPFGTPKYLWFERLKDTAFYHIFPFPNNTDVSDVIIVSKDIILLGDFEDGNTGPDFPIRFIDLLVKLLAHELSHIEGLPIEERSFYRREAIDALSLATQDMNRTTDDNPRIYGAY